MIVVAGPGRPEVKKVEKIIELDERRFALGAKHRVGRAYCRSCGADENVSDMVSGLCPACAYVRTKALADMQRQYAAAVDAGEPDAAARVAEIIAAYEQKERVQLRGAFHGNLRGSQYPGK